MRLSVFGVLLLGASVLGAPSDPKVKPLLAADAEEAAAAQVEEPRDKRDWIHINQAGFVDAFVESDVRPEVVAHAIAAASSGSPGGFPASSVSGRTGSASTHFNQFTQPGQFSQPGQFGQFSQFNQFGHYQQRPFQLDPAIAASSAVHSRTGSTVPFQQLVQVQRDWTQRRDYNLYNEWRRQQGLPLVHWNTYNTLAASGGVGFGFGQRQPDVIDTSPQGRTRIAASASGEPISVYAPHDWRNQQRFTF